MALSPPSTYFSNGRNIVVTRLFLQPSSRKELIGYQLEGNRSRKQQNAEPVGSYNIEEALKAGRLCCKLVFHSLNLMTAATVFKSPLCRIWLDLWFL